MDGLPDGNEPRGEGVLAMVVVVVLVVSRNI